MRIYLDVCCLNRPFDDRRQDRVRLEAEAVLTILNRAHRERWILLSSEVVDFEIAEIPDDDRRQRVSLLSSASRSSVRVDETTTKRATELCMLGFQSVDALHLACAEKGGADILLTTDDRLVQKASQNKAGLKVKVVNPVRWLIEEIEQ